MGTKQKVGLNVNPHFASEFCGTQSIERQLNSLILIPNHVCFNLLDKILQYDTLSRPTIEHSFFIIPKNFSQAELSGKHPFIDMDLVSPASSTRLIQPGHR